MSEPPTAESKQPEPSSEGQEEKSSPGPKGLRPEIRDRLKHRKPIRDTGTWVMVGVVCFLTFMLTYFVYTSWISSTPVLTKKVKPKPEMYPVDRLLSATDVELLSEDGGRAEITYDFAEVAPNRTALDKVLKDWRGARRTLEEMRAGLLPHQKPAHDAKTGLPQTPLMSVVSFDGDLEYTVQFEYWYKVKGGVQLWFFFHYIYDFEVTGPALVVTPEGKAQFVRYRRELTFDDPRGEPGDFQVEFGKRQSVRIVVKEFPARIGFRCIAYDGDREITRADFPPEWGEDRRYNPSEINRRLVADFEQPPQAGFVAVISNPARVIRLHEIQLVGRVADAWRAQRTRTKKILEDIMKPAEKPAKSEKSGPKVGEPVEQSLPTEKPAPPAPAPKTESQKPVSSS